jgi:MFS family permease
MSHIESSASGVRRAWWGTVVLFLVHGLVVSTWVSRIPAVQNALHLPNGVLGLTLLSSAVGAITSIPFAGWLTSRFGSKKVAGGSSLLFCSSLVLPGLAFNVWTLSLALFVFGACAAAMDVSMNAQGVEVEKALGRPTMSRFHGMFSLGGMIGAAIGGVAAARGMASFLHFAISGAVNGLAVLAVIPLLLSGGASHESGHTHRLPLRRTPPVLFALSAIGFCILLAEGAMGDWTAVYLKQVTRAGAGTAAAGYAVFSAAMAVFRFLGDLITARLGALATVRAGSLVAAAGLLWALAVRSPEWALPGFGITGAGFSVIIPLVFGSGGRVEGINPGAGIATVTGIGYVGFIVGPPTIGFVSQFWGLRVGLGIVVICCLISAVLARSMRSLRAGPVTADAPAELHL